MILSVITSCLSASEQILSRAKGIESTVLSDQGGTTPGYKSKIRSLYVNLKDKNNPGLRESVVAGDLPVSKFCKMTSQVFTPLCLGISFFIIPLSRRKWHQRRGRQRTIRSCKRIYLKLSVLKKYRPRRTPSSVRAANRFVYVSSVRL